jgi:hypothetical protein
VNPAWRGPCRRRPPVIGNHLPGWQSQALRRRMQPPLPSKEVRDMPEQDQIINAVMALAIQRDALRTHPLAAWMVTQDEVTYPGEFVRAW